SVVERRHMTPVRVLIVEDEAIVRMDLEVQLQTLGHAVVAAVDNGDEALARAGELRPDLVFMDIRLKGAPDGITTAEGIKKLGIAVIYLTAFADEQTVLRPPAT